MSVLLRIIHLLNTFENPSFRYVWRLQDSVFIFETNFAYVLDPLNYLQCADLQRFNEYLLQITNFEDRHSNQDTLLSVSRVRKSAMQYWDPLHLEIMGRCDKSYKLERINLNGFNAATRPDAGRDPTQCATTFY